MSKIDPYPVDYDTFGKKFETTKAGKDKTGVKHWGTEKRIRSIKEEMEVTKKLNRMNVPGAGSYGM
jgi:hypothetical protein